jgi:hypothetical protein
VGLPPISKSLNFQGFFCKKSRSVTARKYTEVVRHERHIIVSAIPTPVTQPSAIIKSCSRQ